MPLLLILIFPLAEIAGFILVGREIGVFPTLALIVASAAVGLVMLRDAGTATLARLRLRAAAPAAILAEGGARMLAGLLFLIPGFLSDLAAVAVLTPGARRVVLRRFGDAAKNGGGPRQSEAHPSGTIDGDFRRLNP